ncbi:hypothetical protein E2C01_054927 [Portunus trituberculatus]|uniref:Uncharacterized protein n=1 Tax=Portunus trituberculatus TaxID=210409 RepID=A0A5B7GV86_PORTR|nr:hypothetical protein [Portunus trituberculatus]
MGAISRQEVALTLQFLGSSSWHFEHFEAGYQAPPANSNGSLWMLFYKGWYVSRRLIAVEVVCTNIDNNLLLGSCPGAPTYRPAVELSGTQFEIWSSTQFENAVGPILYKQTDRAN